MILDEADEMLDMGFADDIDSILQHHAGGTTDGSVLGDDAGPHQRIGAQVPARSGSHPDRSR